MDKRNCDGWNEQDSRRLFSLEYGDADGIMTPLQGESIIDLYRSLSIGGIVAFVGSGTGYLLGYGSWDDLADGLLDLAKASEVQSDQCISKRLNQALEEIKSKNKDADKASNIDKFDKLALATEIFRQLSSGAGSKKKAKQILSGVEAHYKNKFSFQRPASKKDTLKLIKALRRVDGFSAFADELKARVETYPGDFLPIDYSAGVRFLEQLVQTQSGAKPKPKNESSLSKSELLRHPAPSVDVLGTLRRDWKISRYATLNYDHEIERMLERADFPFYSITPDKDKNDRIESGGKPKMAARSRLGEKARSVDLDPDNVSEFMLFAADSPAGASQVLHLHGSVLQPQHMIVTDIDYNRRYFASAAWAAVQEDSQELLYRGNAIVFVGVGMSEDELFRTMRILSQAPDREIRPVYAFMESKGQAKDASDAIKLFQRYGIRTIFYGTELGDEKDPEMARYDQHSLVLDACADERLKFPGSNPDPAVVSKRIRALSVELDLLDQLKNAIGKEAIDSDKFRKISADLAESISHVLTSSEHADPSSPQFDSAQLPRLLLTPWHATLFKIVWRIVAADAAMSMRTGAENMKALKKAVDDLVSAIRARALEDALQAIAARSLDWRMRWKDVPTNANAVPAGKPHFRGNRSSEALPQIVSHNISQRHATDEPNRKLLAALLRDESGKKCEKFAKNLLLKHKMSIVRSRSGAGKGVLASVLASADKALAKTPRVRRIVASFGQSCGRDPVFDLIASAYRKFDEDPSVGRIEIVLSKADVMMTASEQRPRLSEWEAMLGAIVSNPKVRMMVLCEGHETVNFFSALSQENHIEAHTDTLESSFLDTCSSCPELTAAQNAQIERIHRISIHCNSVWMASFLTGMYADIVMDAASPCALEIRVSAGDRILQRVEHATAQIQDPRQRVPVAIDTAIAQIEHYVLSKLESGKRVRKVIAHAILKHLFAFGGPVERPVFSKCPEIAKIEESYPLDIAEAGGIEKLVREALDWLKAMNMIIFLSDGFSNAKRYGLHSHVRNWLATKKGLPFAVVMGREQTAITVVPIIDEEIVPLDSSDYQFIWDTVDGLLKADSGAAVPAAQIRAAFMLLRGSMRIGTVLRSAHEDGNRKQSLRTPLEEYLSRLLAIRHTAILSAKSAPDGEFAPLFQREWVWLFNEMGVVKLLQGHIHDATIFFEEAIEFETKRLRDTKQMVSFEALAYDKDKSPHEFSITKLRIMINLAQAEIEHGAFNRAKRIMDSEKRDLEQVKRERMGSYSDHKEPEADRPHRKNLHREIRILSLARGLIDARLEYLSGGTGAAMNWLKDHEKTIVAEGVHGLTALYFLIFGDVLLRRKNSVRAAEYFATARAEAEASGRNDLIFSVMLGESQCKIDDRSTRAAADLQQHLSRVRKIKHEARRMGMVRIVVTASMTSARLYLGFGEHRSARQDLMTALTLATANGLNIKRASALIDMAALVASRDPELRDEAKEMAEAARFDAERMGYKLAVTRAKDLELVLRERGSIEDWIFRKGAEIRDSGRGDD